MADFEKPKAVEIPERTEPTSEMPSLSNFSFGKIGLALAGLGLAAFAKSEVEAWNAGKVDLPPVHPSSLTINEQGVTSKLGLPEGSKVNFESQDQASSQLKATLRIPQANKADIEMPVTFGQTQDGHLFNTFLIGNVAVSDAFQQFTPQIINACSNYEDQEPKYAGLYPGLNDSIILVTGPREPSRVLTDRPDPNFHVFKIGHETQEFTSRVYLDDPMFSGVQGIDNALRHLVIRANFIDGDKPFCITFPIDISDSGMHARLTYGTEQPNFFYIDPPERCLVSPIGDAHTLVSLFGNRTSIWPEEQLHMTELVLAGTRR